MSIGCQSMSKPLGENEATVKKVFLYGPLLVCNGGLTSSGLEKKPHVGTFRV